MVQSVNGRRRAWKRFEGTLLVAVGLCGAVTVSCVRRMPAPIGGPAGSPQVGWVIMAGERDSPDQDFVCQSNPVSDCVMVGSRPDRQAFADVHFYFHPASADIRYAGSIRIGFFDGNSQELKPDITVKAGSDVGNHSVVGIVTDRPGAYTMAVAVDVDGAVGAQRIRDDVRVVVK